MLLRGGLVADGIGTTIRLADVLIDGQQVVSIGGNGAPPADCEVIDLAPGSVVGPGFIDAHVHAEGPLLATGRVDGALAQGVTTLVVGQDGESWIGATADTARYMNRTFAPVNGALEPARDLSVAGYRDALSGRLTQNVAVLASQGTIRHNIVGLAPGPLGPGERAAARREVEDALGDGAVGLSSGLDYLPSRFGDFEEVADIARPLAAAGRPYVSHLRGYGPQVRAGLDELAAVGRGAGIRVHASHLWGAPADIRGRSRRLRPRAWRLPSTCTRTASPARLWRRSCSPLTCKPKAQGGHSRRWPIPTRGPSCWPGRSSPTTSCKISIWAACPPTLRSSPVNRVPRRRRAAPSRPGSGFSTFWSPQNSTSARTSTGLRSATTTWPGSRPTSGIALVRTASTKASIPIPADTAASPASRSSTWRTEPPLGISNS